MLAHDERMKFTFHDRTRRGAAAFFIIIGAALLPSCYSAGLRFPGHIRKLAVPVFDNQTFVRGLEFDLTDRVRQLLLERSDIQLVASERDADAVVHARITRVNFPVLVARNRERILEGSSVIAVGAELVETKNQRVLARVRGEDRAEYTTTLGETRESANADLIDALAWRILLGLAARSEEGEAPVR
ncbi:MAG: hypothetical protein HY286_17705 [Planctomycetes bacterium]|nr:hypothetical protein [Planctomycetota bacterium]